MDDEKTSGHEAVARVCSKLNREADQRAPVTCEVERADACDPFGVESRRTTTDGGQEPSAANSENSWVHGPAGRERVILFSSKARLDVHSFVWMWIPRFAPAAASASCTLCTRFLMLPPCPVPPPGMASSRASNQIRYNI